MTQLNLDYSVLSFTAYPIIHTTVKVKGCCICTIRWFNLLTGSGRTFSLNVFSTNIIFMSNILQYILWYRVSCILPSYRIQFYIRSLRVEMMMSNNNVCRVFLPLSLQKSLFFRKDSTWTEWDPCSFLSMISVLKP